LKNIEVGLPPDYMRVLYLESQLDIFDSDSWIQNQLKKLEC
jgi:hypothetical protein